MALFESYERRIDKINSVLNEYGISSIEEAEKITKDAETEALGFLLKEHLAQVSMSQTYFTGIGNRTRDTKCLQSLSDCCGCVRCPLAGYFERTGKRCGTDHFPYQRFYIC